MSEENIKDVAKSGLKYLDKVFEYRSRTVGVTFISNTEDLNAKWEEAQFELGTQYQYQGENERIWDYYLALCCNFDENSLSGKLRFRIENDRFCCRKVFIFRQAVSKFSPEALMESLFPKIHVLKKISFLTPDEIMGSMDVSPKITKDFYTRPLQENELEALAKLLIMESSQDDKNRKN